MKNSPIMITVISILTIIFSLMGCSPSSKNPKENADLVQDEPIASKTKQENTDFECIPLKKVGSITSASTFQKVKEAYGEENVTLEEVPVGEGLMEKAVVVFQGTDKEMTIFWDSEELIKPVSVLIEQPNSPWKTANGISIGKSLDSLEQLNDKPFVLYGFEWDYAGTIISWEGGRLSEGFSIGDMLTLQLGTEKPPGDGYGEVIGDIELSSDHTEIKKMELRVIKMRILL